MCKAIHSTALKTLAGVISQEKDITGVTIKREETNFFMSSNITFYQGKLRERAGELRTKQSSEDAE